EIFELHVMINLGMRVLHTAHEVKTARKAFARLKHFFGDKANDPAAKYPELNALVKEVRNANGQEAVVLKNGGSVEFAARSKSSGRGFSVDILVMDEAQELEDEALEALLSTISASANPLQVMTGTPLGPKANGEVFTRMREVGVAGGDPTLCWMEWGCDGLDVDLDDPENWRQANPALGIRLSYEFTQSERHGLSDAGFARERLGMWGGIASNEVINMVLWSELAMDTTGEFDAIAAVGGAFAFGVDVTPDRARASVALAGKL